MSLPLLVEIGTEEIPDWMIEPALANFSEQLAAVITPLGGSISGADATPRRLVLRAADIIARQDDSEELVTGPPKAAPAGAIAGFAKKMGIAPEALEIVVTPKGEYHGYRRKVAGQASRDILAATLPDILAKIPWPKTMYWTGKSGLRFIRPIRWIVALLGDEIVPFEVAGVRASNITSGHRRLGAARIDVTVAGYETKLRANGVILSADDRKRKIESEIAALLTRDLRVKSDPALLATLAYLTEFPTAILGSFDAEYLTLPAEVLVTVMRHHQRYFSLEDATGKLAPHFIAIMNTDADPQGLVRAGNERVLRARFNDARFFWDTDQKKKLADRVADLANVTFQAKLGSYKEKTDRVVALVRELGGNERAALLAKCDLTTEMVKEFTDLQGIVGGLYAQAQGEPEEVWRAIYEHYKPHSMEDSIPGTRAGQILSLADKIDTLRGCFAIGMVPSGSRDPFALRRATQGVVKILAEGQVSVPLSRLIAGDAALAEFFLDRVRHVFREVRGFQYDEVNAVLAAGYDDLPDVARRLEALQAVRKTPDFEPLAASFKRIKNILKQAGVEKGGPVDKALLEPGPEVDLHAAYQQVRARIAANKAHQPALEAIASLRPAVDLFFDKVLVNAPDAAVRANRLTLLYNLLTEFSAIADFSEIVTAQQPN